MIEVLLMVLSYAAKALLVYASLCFVVAIPAVVQERKIWAPGSVPSLSLYGCLKVYFFNVVWTSGCLIGAILLVPKYLLTGDVSKEAHEWVEHTVARICIFMFVGPVKVVGTERLPPFDPGSPAPVYICNHASQIDVGVVYYIERRWKWIAKSSVKFLPGVGQIMTMSRHVFIDRKTGKNKKSVSNLYDKSNAAVQSGTPMFFFPQGTRRIAEKLPFKDGAFNVALYNKSSLVPMSIEIPLDAWARWYPLPGDSKLQPVVITIHPVIPVKGDEDKAKLREQCSDIIYSVLPPIPGSKEAAEAPTADKNESTAGGDEKKEK